jgi:hypothetical protein
MGSKQSCTKEPTKLKKAYHVDIYQEDGSDHKLLCIYTDPLPDSLIKEIENIIKNKVTKLSECVCRYKWAHLIIFSEEMSSTEIRIVNGLLKKNGYGITTICGIPYEGTEWDSFGTDYFGIRLVHFLFNFLFLFL